MTYRKKLIEVALPLEAINEASAREKSIRHGHPSTLHLWWARRPLAAARAVIFSSLVDDPDSPEALPAFVEACRRLPYIGKNVHTNGDTPRMRLFDFIEVLVKWESTTDEAVLNTARELIMIATEGNPPPLLDPFAGGGTIPLEAQRLGLEAHASDLNPVAVMINKAQIEIPPRFANQPPVNPHDRKTGNSKTGTAGAAEWKRAVGLAADVRYYGEWMRKKAVERIGQLYPTHNSETVVAWLWARTVKSPNPAVNAYVPLMRSFILSNRKGDEYWVKPIVEDQNVRFEVMKGKPSNGLDGTIQRGNGTCIISGVPIPGDYIRKESYEGRMGTMLTAIVTEGANGRNYYSPDAEHEKIAKSSFPEWKPTEEMNRNTPDLVSGRGYGFFQWADLFTSRQLVTLTNFTDLVSEVREFVRKDAIEAGLPDDNVSLRDGGQGATAYAEAISVYLAFGVDKMTLTNTSIATWQTSPTRLTQAFSRQAIPMVWDFAEANPFSNAAGDYKLAIDSLARVIDNFNGSLQGVVQQADATKIYNPKAIMVSTDPPYYDQIGYSDLSDYFYVWIRRSLRVVYPDIFATMIAPKEPELVALSHRFNGDKDAANRHFEKGLQQTFVNARSYITPQYPLTVYYAFKQQDAEPFDGNDDERLTQVVSTGWETILSSIIDAGFSIGGTWPMRTELTTSLKKFINALASSIVLVCRPRLENAPTISRRQFVDALRRELPIALKDMQSGNIAPVDLAQCSIGPGMAIYSRYSKVLEADGSAMSVRTALGLINQELDAYLAEQDGNIDSDTRFAVSWFEQFGFNEGEFGQADVLARAKNTSVAGVEAAGLVVAGRGKVRLKHWTEFAPTGMIGVNFIVGVSKLAWEPSQDKRLTVWEATHHLIERLNTHGETGSAMLMNKMSPDMAAEARNLAYRLYSICERKGWADHARDYNALVISWAGIGEESARLREQEQIGQATTQPRLFE